jgi:hypothetical protein
MESAADFVFGPLPPSKNRRRNAAGEPAAPAAAAADPLGPLAGLAGNWTGQGFNVSLAPTRSSRAGRTASWSST